MMDRTSIELFKEFVENNTMPQLSSFNMPTLASEMPMETFNSSMKDIALPESPRKEDGNVKTVTEAVIGKLEKDWNPFKRKETSIWDNPVMQNLSTILDTYDMHNMPGGATKHLQLYAHDPDAYHDAWIKHHANLAEQDDSQPLTKQEGGASADQAMAIGREWLQNLIYQPGETIPFYNVGRDTIGKLFGQLPASAVKDITFDEGGYPSHKGKPMTEQQIQQLFDKVSSHPAYSQVQEAGRKAKGAEIPEMPQGETVTAMQKFLYMGGVLKAEEAIPEFIPHPAGLKDADGNPIMIRNEAFKKDFFPQPAVGEGITPQDASGFTERLDTYNPDFEEGGAGRRSRAGGSVGNKTKQKRLKSYDSNKRKGRQ